MPSQATPSSNVRIVVGAVLISPKETIKGAAFALFANALTALLLKRIILLESLTRFMFAFRP